MNSARFSLYVRRAHMYLALFLTPWLILYALSSLVFNHSPTIRAFYGKDFNRFEKEKEVDYTASFANDTDAELAGAHILHDLGLDGAFFVRGTLLDGKLTITRRDALSPRRITYSPKSGKLLIERQVFQTPTFLTRLHTRYGYDQSYVGSWIWGATVELTAVAILFWVASGLWLWWEIRPSRKLGAVFMFIGIGLFGLLLATL